MKNTNKLNAVNPSAKNPGAVKNLCADNIQRLTEEICNIVRQYQKNEAVFIAKTQSLEQQNHDWVEVVGMRDARITRLVNILEGRVTDWHKIRDWFLIFATIGQFGFILTHLI